MNNKELTMHDNIKLNSGLSADTFAIVNQRDAKRGAFISMDTELSNIESTLIYISGLKSNALWQRLIEENKCTELWKDIFSKAEALYAKVHPAISADGLFKLAYERASRKYVNIGAVGITREGKSEFIARTTKLGNWLLPRRSESQPCTTAPINIVNGESKDGKTNFARIHYFTVRELVLVLKKNISELGGDEGIVPDNISTKEGLKSWLRSHKSEVDNHLAERVKSADLSKKNEFITGYFVKENDYVNLLKEEEKEKKEDSDVFFEDRTIEAINKGEKDGKFYYSSVSYYPYPNAPQSTKTYKSYATKKAEIYTNFDVAGEEVNDIQFLDTPGIGEQKVGLERSLSDTIAMNLDVILVVKSVRKDMSNQDANRNTLITLLRDRLNRKENAKDSVFFLMNMWPDATLEQANAEISSLTTSLSSKYSSDPIALTDDHVRKINIVGGYELLNDEKVIDNNPLGRYLHDILASLVKTIKNIDADYFKAAESFYKEVLDDFNTIKNEMKQLANNLPSGDISERVDKVLANLNNCLDKKIAAEKNLDGGIKYSVEKFCGEDPGIVLALTIGGSSKGVQDIDDYQEIVAYCDSLKNEFASHYRKAGYLGYMDFHEYGVLKKNLCARIEEEIYNNIDTEQAEKELKKIKEDIAEVFISTGMLGFVSETASTWWDNMISILKKENTSSKLVEIFEKIGGFTIDYRRVLEDKMTEIVRNCKHCDNFGDPDLFNFQEYRKALVTVTHSLLSIEQEIKDSTEEEVIQKKLASLMEKFDEDLSELICAVSLSEIQKPTEERTAMVRFYKRHADEIFKDDDYNRKIALISSWREHLK